MRVRLRELEVKPKDEKRGLDIGGPLAFVLVTTAVTIALSHPVRLAFRESMDGLRMAATFEQELAQNCPGCPSKCISGKCDCPADTEESITPPAPPPQTREKKKKPPKKTAGFDERLNDALLRSPEQDTALATFPLPPLPDRLPNQFTPL